MVAFMFLMEYLRCASARQGWYGSHTGQGSHTQWPNAMCLVSGVCVPTAFPTSAAQLSGIVVPSASLALVAASTIQKNPDYFQWDEVRQIAAGWALCYPSCHGEPNVRLNPRSHH